MNISLLLAGNSIAFGGLLFLLSAGFSLIFGLMRIPNLTHASLFMLGAYFCATLATGYRGVPIHCWIGAVVSPLLVAALGGVIERLLLCRRAGERADDGRRT